MRAGGIDKKTVTRVACSDRHSCALTSTGDLFTWGYGAEGQLGHSLTAAFSKPKLVTSLLHVVAVAAAETHTIALSCPPAGSSLMRDAYIFGCGVTSTPQKIHVPAEEIVSFAAARGCTALLTASGALYHARGIGRLTHTQQSRCDIIMRTYTLSLYVTSEIHSFFYIAPDATIYLIELFMPTTVSHTFLIFPYITRAI